MSFATTQTRMLKAKLKSRNVREREADGQVLHYLEGWHLMAEANRIFGFDGWDRETVFSNCVYTKQIGNRYCAAYVTRIRIIVRAGEERIVREGCGAGESNATSPGQAHEFAAKAAETDATKRALSTFGNAFGLSLYAGGGELSERRTREGARIDTTFKSNGTASDLGIAASTSMSEPASESTVEVQGPKLTALPSGRSQTDRHGNGGNQVNSGDFTDKRATTLPQDDKPISDAAPGNGVASAHPASIPTPDGTPSIDRKRVDKSVLAIAEPRRLRDPNHLRFVARQPCLICGRQPTEAHHLKFSQPSALGRKVSDAFTVPLCAIHHRELHALGNERQWWTLHRLDPPIRADELWEESHSRSMSHRSYEAN